MTRWDDISDVKSTMDVYIMFYIARFYSIIYFHIRRHTHTHTYVYIKYDPAIVEKLIPSDKVNSLKYNGFIFIKFILFVNNILKI